MLKLPSSTFLWYYVGRVCCWLAPFAARGFSPGTPVFPSPQKQAFPNSNTTRKQVDEEPICGCATSKSLFIYYYLFIMLHEVALTVESVDEILKCDNSIESY